MKIQFEEMRYPEVGELINKRGMVLVPIGACEVHGRHLPLNTDTKMAYQAALDAAERVARDIHIAVLPPVWVGYTVWVLKNWPGTISIKPQVLIEFMRDICRSLIDMGITKILIVNGHGNNPGLLDVVVRTIGDDFKVFPGVANIFDQWDRNFVRENRKSPEGGIGHACEIETSVMLHLTDLVDMSVADDTDLMKSNLATCPVDFAATRKKKMYLSTWYLENPTHGAAGDPSQATKEFGEAIHRMTVDGLEQAIREFFEVHERLAGRKLNRADTRF